MPKPPRDFLFVSIAGTPQQRGRSYGEQCADRIRRAVAYYRERLDLDDARLEALARPYLKAVSDVSYALHTEMTAIAEGAGVSVLEIGMMNARSEIISDSECTSVAFPETKILGQTWDWSEHLSDLAILLHVTEPFGRRMLMLTEPGMLGKIGLNTEGLGICLNFLQCPDRLPVGVPLHVLSRLALGARSAQEAMQIVSRYAGGASGHLLIADRSGRAISTELAGASHDYVSRTKGALTHTNHYLRRPSPDRGFIKNLDSRMRLHRLTSGLGDVPPDEASLQRLLQQGGMLFPICRRRGRPFEQNACLTLAVVTMDLQAKRFSIKRGAERDAPFRHYHL